MKDLIQQRAFELGFDLCGFTRADAPAAAKQFERWLASRCHGEMAYLERNARKRLDPQQVLEGVRTVIVLAASYEVQSAQPTPHSSPLTPHLASSAHGLIARYARYADYHQVLGDRLRLLTDYANELGGPGARSLWYVDTGPVLERDFAQRAGVGFIGKHTNLISRRLGNWVFLAEILTTLELPPDAPEKNRCGSCARCLSACPTRAIVAPFQLDARRCISYLTIELKGSIPLEFRRALGNRVFGCDDCLAVCPWNRFARAGNLMKPHARPDLATPNLLELLSLDEAGFKQRFAGTPILRTKLRGLRRNTCVALGNVGDASALPALQRTAGDAEPLIAEHARWALEEIERRDLHARH